MNQLLSPELISKELVRRIRAFEKFRRHPAFRSGLSRSHRRKILKQLKIDPIIRIRIPPKYMPAQEG